MIGTFTTSPHVLTCTCGLCIWTCEIDGWTGVENGYCITAIFLGILGISIYLTHYEIATSNLSTYTKGLISTAYGCNH